MTKTETKSGTGKTRKNRSTSNSASVTRLPGDQSWALMATCPKGVEFALAGELAELGAESVTESVAAVYFEASQEVAYRICLWSRIASRILILLDRCMVNSREEMEQKLRELPWGGWFSAYNQTCAVDFSGSNRDIRDSRYGAQLVKDAINDHFQQLAQPRIRIDLQNPDVLVYARLFKNKLSIGLDLIGERLHKRGYRQQTGEAPLRENLAAALLRIAGWNALVKEGQQNGVLPGFVDPMCGSGTVVIEAALIALGVAPNALPCNQERQWALAQLRGYDDGLWQKLRKQAVGSLGSTQPAIQTSMICGFDVSNTVLSAARQNIEAAGLEPYISVKQVSVSDLNLTETPDKGFILCNPPYGKRLGDASNLSTTYQALGDCFKRNFQGWEAAIFTGNPDLGWSTGLRSWRQHHLFNGAIPCDLQRYRIVEERFIAPREGAADRQKPFSDSAQMLYNRLKKNRRRLQAWLTQSGESCYRIYDADLPEYAVAIDIYTGYREAEGFSWKKADSKKVPVTEVHCQEYAPPASVSQKVAETRLNESVDVIRRFLEIERDAITVKTRSRQRGRNQYQKHAASTDDFWVEESGYRFLVNLSRYLDAGIFLDHRPVRQLIAREAKGKQFLNLFAYTASASVFAAKSGARSSVSVDMSKTYLEWAQRNFEANNISPAQHQLIQADCLQWLQTHDRVYDVILLDPPSFSNSKRMDATLDVQRDHVALVDQCMRLLSPQGTLIFSNNRRGFKLDETLKKRYRCIDLTESTTAPDFKQSRLQRFCWKLAPVAEQTDA